MRSLSLALVAFMLLPSSSMGAGFEASYLEGEVTHDGGFGGDTVSQSLQHDSVVAAFPYDTFESTITGLGENVSTAALHPGVYLQPNEAGFALQPNDGLTQYAPAGGNTDAVLTFEFWQEGSGSGHEYWQVSGAYSFLLEGNVTAGGHVGFHFSATWAGGVYYWDGYEGNYRGDYEKNVVVDWERTDPGPFSVLLQDVFYAGDTPPAPEGFNASKECDIVGTIQFSVHNNGGPNSIGLTAMNLGQNAVPEPSVLASLLTGALGLMVWVSRRRRRA